MSVKQTCQRPLKSTFPPALLTNMGIFILHSRSWQELPPQAETNSSGVRPLECFLGKADKYNKNRSHEKLQANSKGLIHKRRKSTKCPWYVSYETTFVKQWKRLPGKSNSPLSNSELCLNQLHSLNMIKTTFKGTNTPQTRLIITACNQACCW